MTARHDLSRLAIGAFTFLLCASAAAAPLSDKDAAALRSACEDVVARTTLQRARAGILVATEDGKVVYQHDADELLNPASNVKLFSSAAALVRLGPDYRWETDFLLRDPIKSNGEVKDLYVRGNGDPTLGTQQLYEIVAELYHQGLRTITGTIYLDDSYFDGDRVGPGFDQETSDRAYMAPTGALSLNANAVEINVFPGAGSGAPARVELEPASDYFNVTSNAVTVRSSDLGRVQVKLSVDGEKQKLEVKGRVPFDKPGTVLYRKVDRPDLYFGATLKQLLKDRGIKFRGKIKHAQTPQDAKIFYGYESDPLAVAVRRMNKTSSNFIAEQLVKTLGANQKGPPGSWTNGVEAIEDFLEQEVGIPRGTYVMKNGSGLNDTNRFSASQIVKLLGYMEKRFQTAPEYLTSLGIAGKDGTVRGRMEGTDAAGRLRAKTGTLDGVTSLSGIVESVGGQKFLFAMVVNDYPGKHAQVNAAMDDLGVAIAEAGGAVSPDQAARQMVANSVPVPSPMAELRQRVTTFGSLGKLHDKRNLPFLRTALRTERDPAVRAVVAEAMFASDPSDSSNSRAVLDNWSATPEVFGRLQAVGRDLGTPMPVIGALLDIAADGSPEALGHVVECAPLSANDAPLSQMLSDGLEQISRNAPDELLVAMHLAPADTSRSALDLLVRGIAASTDPSENPFPRAIAEAEAGKDPDLALYAHALQSEFQTKLALARAAPKVNAPTPTNTATPNGTIIPAKDKEPGKTGKVEPATSPMPKG
ncbi:MAG: D-alanyl-D-alanine carboxypeptidase/D-alanyl-D-alanine-endopeptidase [Deltaproteobacteria bacterium]|nr:D-alanyl-D-alanine carboxypeptidase/D-alanyl-D-alanine-endopeptidase [Deltaproteobacteria bacterium]